MTLRRRLTLWYGAVLAACLLLASWPSYKELILEAPEHTLPGAKPMEEFGEVMEDIATFCIPPIILGLVIGWWLTKRALRPLQQVTAAAERLTERTLGERLPEEKRDAEIARLAEVFNAMLARLEAAFTRVREFTLHASHELKTPLAILRCSVEESARDWKNLEPAQRAQLASQIEEIERLARIVDDLGTLTKADAGQLPLSFRPLLFDELVREMTDDAEALAKPKQIDVRLESCEVAPIHGDRQRLRQLLLNLVDNAIKHNHAEGHVIISLHRKNGTACLTLSNTGPGLNASQHAHVFERFFRGPDNGGQVEGSGLGLAIAHWIVTAHHGTIRFDSAPHAMTTVTVNLPTTREVA
jgi:signal transduction histidine kinase